MQGRMAAREKNPSLPPPLSFAPLGQAVMETFREGVVVFDSYGRMLYANKRARRTIDPQGDGAAHQGQNVREQLVPFQRRGPAPRPAPPPPRGALLLRDRRNGAVPCLRPRLCPGVRPLRHLSAAQGRS